MPITEFSAGHPRRQIICFGEMPSEDEATAFIDRGYLLLAGTHENLTNEGSLSVTDAVVFSQSEDHPSDILETLEKYARTLLDFDCRVYVRVSAGKLQEVGRRIVVNAVNTTGLPLAGAFPAERLLVAAEIREREGQPLSPYVHVADSGVGWRGIAQLIANNPSGKAPNLTLKIYAIDRNGGELKLDSEDARLLRRAFSDCHAVHLTQMQDGLSTSVSVFRAHAELAGGLEGRWPFLQFVKVGSRQITTREYDRYQNHALTYVPFNLGPRLNLARCNLGSTRGILVGDFVEHTESLRDCARSGRALQAVGSLFSRTLQAWQLAATEDMTRSIPDCLGHLFPVAIPSERDARIRALGARFTLSELRARFDRCDSRPVSIGTIHSDLNATNVLVRFGDAIVIDFEQLQEGMPLIYDPASVEASLLVDAFHLDGRPTEEWLKSIERLYKGKDLYKQRTSCHPTETSAWFFECVREIRRHAYQLERKPGQYATALALALLKKSCNPNKFCKTQECHRAAAFVLAERLLVNLTV